MKLVAWVLLPTVPTQRGTVEIAVNELLLERQPMNFGNMPVILRDVSKVKGKVRDEGVN